jgi:hypothetical protein
MPRTISARMKAMRSRLRHLTKQPDPLSRLRRACAALPCSWSVLLSLRRNPLLRVSELILFVIPLLSEAIPLLESAFPASLPPKFPQHLSASLALAFYQSALVSAGNLCVDTICPGPVGSCMLEADSSGGAPLPNAPPLRSVSRSAVIWA